MAKYKLKQGALVNSSENSLNKIIEDVVSLSIPLQNSCCYTGTAPTANQVLSYNATTSKYEPKTISGVASISNLAYVASATNGVVTNDNGTGFTIPLVDATNAGLATPSMFSALSASSPTTAQMGVSNTYIAVTDPSTGNIDFVVDGITQMTISQGKITTSSFFDPSAVGFTKMSTTQAATVTGALYNDSIYIDSATNHLFRGSKDLEANAGTITSVFGRSTAAIVSENGDYTASQITNVPSGSISAATVQAALNELDTEKASNVIGTLTLTNTDVISTDTVSQAIGKLQAQLDNTVNTTVENILTSTSTVNALSTAQGKILQDTKLTSTLADGKVFIGSASNVATEQTLSGQATISNVGVVTLDNASVIEKVLTGFTSSAGTIAATDSILQAIQKVDGNSKVDASETVKGIVELATLVETETGTSTTLVPTVKTISDTYIKKQFLSNGDLLVGGIAGAETVLAKASQDGYVLTVDSTNTTQQISWKQNVSYRYVQDFVPGDFVIGSSESTITILATTHLVGIYPRVDVEQLVGVDYEAVTTGVTKKANGDVVLTVSNPNTFTGRVIIS